ncbi:MAG TPA: phenylalanine--tRNA ligase subunit beta, partial [Candidatus Binatia bacterium]
MKFTYRWLQDFIDLPAAFKPKAEESPHGLAHALTMAGLEVDSLKPCGQDSKVLVALVKEVRPHPRSDHLSLCKVDCGGEQLQVVCGAPNVRAGIKAPLA